jgi:hypothetical protein
MFNYKGSAPTLGDRVAYVIVKSTKGNEFNYLFSLL